MANDITQDQCFQQDRENYLIPPSNYTQIPNVVLDHWMPRLSHHTFKVLICICRNTLGWHRDKTGLSFKEIQEATGVAISTIQKSVKDLIQLNLIYKKSGVNKQTNEVNVYLLHVQEVCRNTAYVCREKKNEDERYDATRHTPMPPYGNIIKKESKEKKERERIDDSLLFFGKYVKMSKESYEGLSGKYTKETVDDFIERINDHLSSSGKKPYLDYPATIRNWIKKEKPCKNPTPHSAKPPSDPAKVEIARQIRQENINRDLARQAQEALEDQGRGKEISPKSNFVKDLTTGKELSFCIDTEEFKKTLYRWFGLED